MKISDEARQVTKTIQSLEIAACQENKNLLHPDFSCRILHTIQQALDEQAAKYQEGIENIRKLLCQISPNDNYNHINAFYSAISACNTLLNKTQPKGKE